MSHQTSLQSLGKSLFTTYVLYHANKRLDRIPNHTNRNRSVTMMPPSVTSVVIRILRRHSFVDPARS